jgi:hypothetical protein
MMLKAKKKILPILVSTIFIVMLAMPRTRAQDTKNAKVVHIPEQSDAPKIGHHEAIGGSTHLLQDETPITTSAIGYASQVCRST